MMDQFHHIESVPPNVQYIPGFISEEEEKEILNNVYGAPKPKWTCLSNRKLQNWGGLPHSKGMVAEDIPQWLFLYMDKVNKTMFPTDKPSNHVLVNEYLPGQGILPHLDGPLFHPTICTISCGSHTVLNFHPQPDPANTNHRSSDIVCSLLLERRSLVVIQEDMYHMYPHSIEETTIDTISKSMANLRCCGSEYQDREILERGTRVSLTIRHVPHTTKFKIKFCK